MRRAYFSYFVVLRDKVFKQYRYRPDTCEPDNRIYYPRKNGHLSAECQCNKIYAEKSDKSPVQRTNYDYNQRCFVKHNSSSPIILCENSNNLFIINFKITCKIYQLVL